MSLTASGKFFQLLRLGAEFLTAQLAARLLAAASSLLLVRLMPVQEYGYFTLFLAAFTFVCTFSDLGITETLAFFRRRAMAQARRWQTYVQAVLHVRRRVFAIAALASGIYLAYLGHKAGQQPAALALQVGCMTAAAWLAIHAAVSSYVLKLEQQFRQAYAVETSTELAKLAAIAAVWALGLGIAEAGAASVLLGAAAAAYLGRRLVGIGHPSAPKQEPLRIRRRMRLLSSQITPVLPGVAYFAMQGPLIAWLASQTGNVETLAQVGALGRLGIVVGILAGFTGSVLVPKLVAVQDPSRFLRRYLQWWAVVLVYGATILLMVVAMPELLLAIIGSAYAGLHTELLLVAATAVFASWGAYSWHVNRARGWVKYQPYRVPVLLACQLLLLAVMDFPSAQAVLLFALLSTMVDVAFQTAISVAGLMGRGAT